MSGLADIGARLIGNGRKSESKESCRWEHTCLQSMGSLLCRA